MKQLFVNCESLQIRVALVENGRLEEYSIERADDPRIVGSIYKGRIKNLESSLQAAFVDIGLEKNAFLHYWDMVPASLDRLEEDDEEDEEDGDDEEAEAAEGAEADATPVAAPEPGGQAPEASSQEADGEDDDDDGDDGGEEISPPARGLAAKNGGGGDHGGNGGGDNGGDNGGARRRRRPRGRRRSGDRRNDGPRAVSVNAAPTPAAGTVPVVVPEAPPPAKRALSLTERLRNLFFTSADKPEPTPAPPPAPETPRPNVPVTALGADAVEVPGAPAPRTQGRPANRQGNRPRNRQEPRDAPRSEPRDEPRDAPGDEPGDEGDDAPAARRDRRPDSGRGRRPHPRRARTVDIEEIPRKFQVNSDVVVQVTKGMIGEKGPRVTTNLSIPGRYTVLLPNADHRGVSRRIEDRKERVRLREVLQKIELPRNMGLICRTAGIGLSEEAIRLDVEYLLEKWAEAEKTTANRRAPVCVYAEPSLLERTIRDCLAECLDEIVVDDAKAFEVVTGFLRRLPAEQRPRVRFYDDHTPIFQRFRIDDQVDRIFHRNVKLPSGAELVIDETEALIAIDVNSGRSRGGKDHPETILKTNLEAAEEVARQLRLRNVGGLVVVDFIDMRDRRDQLQVYRKMRDCLARDRAKTKILPLSRLGLMEMTRQREHESLQDTVYDTCPYCKGRGLVQSATSVSVEIQRRLREQLRRTKGQTPIRVTVHPRVLHRLKHEDAGLLQAMEREYGGELSFRADPAVHQEEFHLVDTRTGKEL